MRKHTIFTSPGTREAAYVANGFVGLRVGTNPLSGQTALLAGFTGSHERYGVEAYAPVPAPQFDIAMDGDALSQNPDGYALSEQTYDFSAAELLTSFSFTNHHSQALQGSSLVYCSRTSPSLVVEELQLAVRQECDLTFSILLDPTKLPVRTRLTVSPRRDCDGVLLLESRDASGTAGVAVYIHCEGDGEFHPVNGEWGMEQERVYAARAVRAVPGNEYRFRTAVSYVPGALHSEPHWQAVRMVKIACWKGFSRLREENRKAWAARWESRIRLIGATVDWQEVVDASFFYLTSSMHPSSPQSVAPFGLSQRDAYKGHVFWDVESFMFMLPLLTDPASARAMLEYRFHRLEAARQNAMIHGYSGVMFPWQSGATGDEVTRVSSSGGAGSGEQHVNLDVAMAFVAYARVSGDQVFKREMAWPVVKGVAEWIESRVERTARGYEILGVTGIDEGADNVNNDSYTNIMSRMVLENANVMAVELGYPPNASWSEISRDIVIPLNGSPAYIEQHEGCKVKDTMHADPLMAFFPYGYSHGRDVYEATMRFYLEHGLARLLWLPMMSGFLGVIPARLGDRAVSREFFDAGNLPFRVDPFMMWSEIGRNSPRAARTPEAGSAIFLTGRGSLLSALPWGLRASTSGRERSRTGSPAPSSCPKAGTGSFLRKSTSRGDRPASPPCMASPGPGSSGSSRT